MRTRLTGTSGLAIAIGTMAIAIVVARLAGYSAYVVTGGSMEPAIPVGGLIVVQAVRPDTIRVGDVITVALLDRVVTHRVESVSGSDDTLAFGMRGDANLVADPWLVHPGREVGAVRATLPVVGALVSDVQRWWRPIALALLLWLILDVLVSRVRLVRHRPHVPSAVSP